PLFLSRIPDQQRQTHILYGQRICFARDTSEQTNVLRQIRLTLANGAMMCNAVGHRSRTADRCYERDNGIPARPRYSRHLRRWARAANTGNLGGRNSNLPRSM